MAGQDRSAKDKMMAAHLKAQGIQRRTEADVRALALAVMERHDVAGVLGYAPPPVKFTRSAHELGCILWRMDVSHPGRYIAREFRLSRAFALYGEDLEVEDTVKHEVAHLLAGARAEHGPEWVRCCGITGALPLAVRSAVSPNAVAAMCPWVYTCGQGCEVRRPGKLRNDYRCAPHRLPLAVEGDAS